MTLVSAARRMPATKPVGKPDAGNPHVRFDERGGETDRLRGTVPLLDSTQDLVADRHARLGQDQLHVTQAQAEHMGATWRSG